MFQNPPIQLPACVLSPAFEKLVCFLDFLQNFEFSGTCFPENKIGQGVFRDIFMKEKAHYFQVIECGCKLNHLGLDIWYSVI
jgi:hypothetical protein